MKYLKVFEKYYQNYYHGSKTLFPFESFNSTWDGTGIVSGGNKKKYGGFFFTDDKHNADFYTDYGWIATVEIDNVEKINSKNIHTILKKSKETNKNYLIEDVLDGSVISNVIVVPHINIKDITIINWTYNSDKEYLFEKWNEFFSFGDIDDMHDVDGNLMEISQDIIKDTLDIILDFNYLYDNIPLFKEYYDSKY